MKEEKVKELQMLFFEFSPLFHEKIVALFRRNDDIEPICYKNQVRALFILERRQKVTASEMGKCLDMERGSVTSLVDSLVELGLVFREPDLMDRRKIWLKLTPAGASYLSKKHQVHGRNFQELFRSLTEEEVQSATEALNILSNILRKI